MPHLHAFFRGQREDPLLVARLGAAQCGRDKDAHHVLISRVTFHPRLVQDVDEAGQAAGDDLDPQLEDAASGPLQLFDRPLGRDLAFVHDDHVIARELDVRQQMRRENQADTLVMAKVADELEHLVAALRIHAVGRFVEEEQIGIVDDCLRELDALLHPGRVGFEVAITGLAETDVVEHFMRALHGVDGWESGELAAVRDKRDGVHAGNMAIGFRHVAEPRPNLHRPFGDVETEHLHAALVRRDEPEQRLEHRALAGAVWSEQPDRASFEPRADVLERLILAVDDRHALEVHGWLAVGGRTARHGPARVSQGSSSGTEDSNPSG